MKSWTKPAVATATFAATLISSPALADGHMEAADTQATPPVPIAFEGGHELGVSAVRQRILSQKLGYILTVDAEGIVTDCQLSNEFRMRATTIAMCRPFMKHMTFEPARDENGQPTVGTYAFEIDFNMVFDEKGQLERRFRGDGK